MLLFKGQKKSTVSCHTPNRVYTKKQFPNILTFLTSAVYSECDFKVYNSNEIHDGLNAAIGEGLTWLGHSARGILYLGQLPATLLKEHATQKVKIA